MSTLAEVQAAYQEWNTLNDHLEEVERELVDTRHKHYLSKIALRAADESYTPEVVCDGEMTSSYGNEHYTCVCEKGHEGQHRGFNTEGNYYLYWRTPSE